MASGMPGRDGLAWAGAPREWRRGFAGGVALTALLIVAALVLVWREQRTHEQQAISQAQLVVGGIERQVHARARMLGMHLQAIAGSGTTDAMSSGARAGTIERADPHGILRTWLERMPVAPAVRSPGGAAGQPLQLLPPAPGASEFEAVWTGTPGVRVRARMRADWWAQAVQDLGLPPRTIVNLIHEPSQRIYARSPHVDTLVGRSVKGSRLFTAPHRGRDRGVYDAESVLDGEHRQFVYRRIGGTPLVAVVGTPRQEIKAAAAGFVATVLVVALLLGALWLWLLRAFDQAHLRHVQLLAQLEQAQQLALLGSWRRRIDDGSVEWDAQCARIFGIAEDLPPVPMAEIMRRIHPDDVPALQRRMALADRAPQELMGSPLEYRIVRDDGALRWVQTRIQLVADGVLSGIMQDITAQVADRERLHQAQDIARIGDWEWDLASGAIRWSRTMYDIYGLDPDSFVPDQDSAFSRIHPDDRARIQAVARTLAEGGKPCHAEFRILRPDGEERVLNVRGMRETTADGRTVIRSVQQDITELARAREALRRAERQYRLLFEHNPVPMWVFDPGSLRFLAANEAMLRHYGYSREQLLGMTILDIRPEADRPRAEARARSDAAGRAQGEVWTHLRADGSALRMSIHTADIDFEGRDARLVAAQDVTEREANEQRFRLVARATSDGIYDYDITAGTLWWGARFYAAFGLDPATVEPTLQGWEALVHPDDVERVSAGLALAESDPDAESWEDEYRFRRGDGTYADVVDRGYFARDQDGRATRLVGGMLDISDKRRREADLRLLSRAVEAASNGVAIADARAPDTPLVYVNRAFEQMTGYRSEEALGRNCRFLQGDDREQHGIAGVRDAIARGREVRVLLRNYRPDGSMFWNELYLAPVHDGSGELTHFVGIQTDVSEQHRYQQELAYRATHDALTGLPNRQLLRDRLQQAILNADRYGRKAAVVFLDLDDFKLINDSLDHAAGDEALRIVATRLQAQVRGTDTVGRFGGDEFVVVLTEQDQEDGVGQVTARLMRALAAPIDLGGVSHVLTPSIGWARYPDDGKDADTLLKHADMAMYQAKRSGRNRAEHYRPELDAQVSQRVKLVAELRMALARQEFCLAFQPLFGADGRAHALEALVRWQHPERGLLAPGEFIPVCEESGLILELGRWILREAGRHHRLLAEHGFGHLRIAVNVSALQFGPALERDVAVVIAEFALPNGVLELEITESVVLDKPEIAIDTMRRINALGVRISIDDFGTGYSSLAYLKQLPLDRLKIDRSFVRDLPHDREAASICEAILQLARSLELGTVAEGVETPEQLAWLRDRGCGELQGYLLARPAPFEDILSLLGSGGLGP